MRALTLTQSWATLVAIGEKSFETRSWQTDYRGLLAIHAAKEMPGYARASCDIEPFKSALAKHGITRLDQLPRGAIIATAYLHRVLPTTALRGAFGAARLEQELAFGDFGPGRFMWVLARVVALPEPVPATGALGLWNWIR